MSDTGLKTELEHFEKIREDLVKQHQGKFALIKGEKLLGTFDTADNA